MGGGPPSGFLYYPETVSPAEESSLVEHVRAIAFSPVEMRGQVARRRTAHFGWVYGYESWRITPGPPLPEFLLPLRARVAALAAVEPEPRSAYVLTGEARQQWQHSIPPLRAPRYSVTFRTLRVRERGESDGQTALHRA